MAAPAAPVADAEPLPAVFEGALPWHRTLATELLADRAHLPHALLLAGDAGIGKHGLAAEIARALLCEAPAADGLSCGRCLACGYVTAGAHPDLRRLEPVDVDEDGERKLLDAIPVAHVRSLIDWVQITSHRGVAKVAIVEPAERMNAAAANALLKTLEEPPAATYLLLVADQPGRLPATIRSRCRVVPVPRPAAADARAWLAALGVADAGAILAQAGGAPELARDLADPALQAERRVWLTALAAPRRLSAPTLAARIDTADRDERKARLAAVVDWLANWVADLARAAAGVEVSRNVDYADALGRLGGSVAPVALSRYYRALLRCRAQLAHPLQPRLLVEGLLIEYQALFR